MNLREKAEILLHTWRTEHKAIALYEQKADRAYYELRENVMRKAEQHDLPLIAVSLSPSSSVPFGQVVIFYGDTPKRWSVRHVHVDSEQELSSALRRMSFPRCYPPKDKATPFDQMVEVGKEAEWHRVESLLFGKQPDEQEFVDRLTESMRVLDKQRTKAWCAKEAFADLLAQEMNPIGKPFIAIVGDSEILLDSAGGIHVIGEDVPVLRVPPRPLID